MAKQYHLKLKGYVGGSDFDSGYVDYILSKNTDKQVDVLIDSLGGSLPTALSIVAAFRNHGNVTAHFVGMNASAATIASLGAKHVSIESSAMYLVHKVSTSFFEWGSFNADQLQQMIDHCKQMQTDLEKMDGTIAEMYAAKCKKSPKDLLNLMKIGGWLTAKEAKEWGFVDEIVESSDNTAPSLTSKMVASMNEAGIPIPSVPVIDKEKNLYERIVAYVESKFKSKAAVEEPAEEPIASVAEQPKPTTNTMKKTLKFICALFAVEFLTLEDGKASLSEEQLDALENALADKDKQLADANASVSDKDAKISELQQQITNLQKAPGASSQSVVNDKGNPDAEKTVEEQYIDTVNSARELFNSLP